MQRTGGRGLRSGRDAGKEDYGTLDKRPDIGEIECVLWGIGRSPSFEYTALVGCDDAMVQGGLRQNRKSTTT